LNKQKDSYTVVGLMSGTSLDGLDLCACRFTYDKQWKFEIVEAETKVYSSDWENILLKAENCSARELNKIHCEYGKYLGKTVNQFIKKHQLKVDLVSSHGHTIFHQPEDGYTLQIGHGGFICEEVKLTTVVDFRSQDIAVGGQGAPLVPFGEKYLFPEHKHFLNIGGIANLSVHEKDKSIAFDVSAANMVLNYISKKYYNKEYDKGGEIAAKGKTNESLLQQLNSLNYFKKSGPKSLGKEDVFKWMIPILDSSGISAEDQLNTFITHLCNQIEGSIKSVGANKNESILVSGGGAYNHYLIKKLKNRLSIEIPTNEVIDYKEALIFAFLGLYRFLGKKNTLSSVTGAKKAVCAGSIFTP